MGSHLSSCITEVKASSFASKTFLNPIMSQVQRHCSHEYLNPKDVNIKEEVLIKSNLKRSRSFSTQINSNYIGDFQVHQNDIKLNNFTILREFDSDKVYKGKRYLVSKKSNPNLLFTMTNCKKTSLERHITELFLIQKQVFESNNPFLSKVQYLIENKTSLFIFQTYFSGLDFAFQLNKINTFKEKMARFYLAEIILALENLPSNVNLIQSLIYYLDLKSMLLDRDGHLSLNIVSPILRATKKIGSSPDERYYPPEYFQNSIDKSTSSSIFAWKLGIFLYEMLSGIKPFHNSDEILQNDLKFSHDFPASAVDLIRQLLLTNSQKRLGNCNISELKNHDFFQGVDWNEIFEKRMIGPLALSSKQENRIFENNQEKPHIIDLNIDLENEDEQCSRVSNEQDSLRKSTAEKTQSYLSNVSEEDEEVCIENNDNN